MPLSADLMLPSAVLTHKNAGRRAVVWPQRASLTWPKQARPSLSILQRGAKLHRARAKRDIDRPVETGNRRGFGRAGLLSGVVSTAATKVGFPVAPRPRLPPERSLPRQASSISTSSVRRFARSRFSSTCWSLSLTIQGVFWRTLSHRPNSRVELPCMDWVSWYIARHQVSSGNRSTRKRSPRSARSAGDRSCTGEKPGSSLRYGSPSQTGKQNPSRERAAITASPHRWSVPYDRLKSASLSPRSNCTAFRATNITSSRQYVPILYLFKHG